ncbi:MAG: DinB family protein [Micropruina sp.]
MTWGADLVDQLDFYWTVHFRPRLVGLTDAEYRWEPVPGMWSVRPDATGRMQVDLLVPEPPIPPLTTIAWRLDHISRGVLGIRARALFGGSPAGDADDIDMFDDRHWPEPRPATASEALAELDLAYQLWRDGVAACDDEALGRPLGPRGAAFAESSLAQLVFHINREVMAHGAEICLLRDLYRAEQQGRDPLVAAALRGDADAVRRLDVSGARVRRWSPRRPGCGTGTRSGRWSRAAPRSTVRCTTRRRPVSVRSRNGWSSTGPMSMPSMTGSG